MALPLGELSPQVTERVLPFALSVLAALGHLSQGERQGVLHHEICLTNQIKQEQAQQIIPLCLLTVSCSPLIYFCSFKYDAKARATSRLSLGGMYSSRA